MPIVNGVRVSREALVGDPFFGIALRALGGLGKTGLLRRAAGAVGGIFGMKRVGAGIPAAAAAIVKRRPELLARGPVGRVIGAVGGALPGAAIGGAVAGVAGSAAEALMGGRRARGMPGRRRRMNALNPRALRRALRRAQSFERFCRRTVTITRRMKFRRRRRR